MHKNTIYVQDVFVPFFSTYFGSSTPLLCCCCSTLIHNLHKSAMSIQVPKASASG